MQQVVNHQNEVSLNKATSKEFANLQLQRNNVQLCDITFQTEDGSTINAHWNVLRTIPYFDGMLRSGMKEVNQKYITFGVLTGHTLEALISFAYTGKLTVAAYNVKEILFSAVFLGMNEVEQFCCSFIAKRWDYNNVLPWRSFAKSLHCPALVEQANYFICKYFKSVTKTEEWHKLELREVLHFLSCSELNVKSEEEVFTVASSWVKHNPKERGELMHELLNKVRLPLIRKKFLTEVIHTDPACIDSPECQELIKKTRQFHIAPYKRRKRHSSRYQLRYVIPTEQITPRFCTHTSGTICHLTLPIPVQNVHHEISDLEASCKVGFGVSVLNDTIYMVGGIIASLNEDSQMQGTVINSVDTYSFRNDEWSEATPMSTHRHNVGTCVLHNKIYACGGMDYKFKELSSCEVFDPETKQWTPIPRMKHRRQSAAVVCFQGYVWALGGGSNSSTMNSVEYYNPWAKRWTLTTPMLSKRQNHRVAALNDKLYVFGGLDLNAASEYVDVNAASEYVDTCEMFDSTTCQFTYIKPMTIGRSDFGIAISNRRIHCTGGLTHAKQDDDKWVMIYDPEKDEWTAGDDADDADDDSVVLASAFIPSLE